MLATFSKVWESPPEESSNLTKTNNNEVSNDPFLSSQPSDLGRSLKNKQSTAKNDTNNISTHLRTLTQTHLDDFMLLSRTGFLPGDELDRENQNPEPYDAEVLDNNQIGNGEEDHLNSPNHLHREPKSISIYQGVFHIFKANVGTGVFLLPTFYRDSGYVMSPILGVLIAACVIQTTLFLVKVKTDINRPQVENYGEVCQFVFGRIGYWILMVSLVLTQFGLCLLYTQLTIFNAGILLSFKGKKFVFGAIIFVLEFFLSVFSNNLYLLSLISMIATISVLFCFFATWIVAIDHLHTHGMNDERTAVGHTLPIGWFNNIANNMMVLEGIAIVLPVENGSRDKKHIPLMLQVVLSIIVGLYLIYGLIGYLAYGENIGTSLVDAMPMNALGTVVRAFFITNLLCTYPVQFLSAIQLLDWKLDTTPTHWKGILLRIVVHLIICIVGVSLKGEDVDYVVGLIGAIPATIIVLIIPSLLMLICEYSIRNAGEKRESLSYWKHIFYGSKISIIRRVVSWIFLFFSVLIMVLGTYSIFRRKSDD